MEGEGEREREREGYNFRVTSVRKDISLLKSRFFPSLLLFFLAVSIIYGNSINNTMPLMIVSDNKYIHMMTMMTILPYNHHHCRRRRLFLTFTLTTPLLLLLLASSISTLSPHISPIHKWSPLFIHTQYLPDSTKLFW